MEQDIHIEELEEVVTLDNASEAAYGGMGILIGLAIVSLAFAFT